MKNKPNQNICNVKQVLLFFSYFLSNSLPPSRCQMNTSPACEVRSKAGVAKGFVFRLIFVASQTLTEDGCFNSHSLVLSLSSWGTKQISYNL